MAWLRGRTAGIRSLKPLTPLDGNPRHPSSDSPLVDDIGLKAGWMRVIVAHGALTPARRSEWRVIKPQSRISAESGIRRSGFPIAGNPAFGGQTPEAACFAAEIRRLPTAATGTPPPTR
jgi:hypothetical protein